VGISQCGKRAIALLLAVGIVGGIVVAAGAVQAIVLTNLGQVVEGALTGIAPVIRLLTTDGITSIGPGPQYDVSLDSISQITLDFPRIVIETADHTLIGPYSSFSGIAEALQLDRSGEPTVTFPTASLRAIALNGHALHPVPRTWLGNGFLSMPEIAAASPFVASECVDCTITPPRATETDDSTPIWDGLTPEYVPEEPAELPWWVGLLGVAVLVVVAMLLTSLVGPSS